MTNRASGVLLHPTSLPNRHGIGSLGSEARAWVAWLARAKQSLWQVMPLGHTGYGDSPYQCFSAFAGNPLLVSLEGLQTLGFLNTRDLETLPDFPQGHVDYGWVYVWKWQMLRKAHTNFVTQPNNTDYQNFCATNQAWLEDYALFMALKNKHEGASWVHWDAGERTRDPNAMQRAKQELAHEIDLYRFVQWQFYSQWNAIKHEANQHGIRIIGDIPIFVAHDSSDVWANQHLFCLNPDGSPSVVAGVPPDYFSATGQLWGNPHYRWDVMQHDGFAWWLQRVKATLEMVDVVRVDHFRGFDAYWEVPGDAENAIVGRWVKAPGQALFETIRASFGDLPIIAEDLGVITPEVEALRDGFGLPGMKILQFAFYGDNSDPFLPHNHTENCVVYTGTHDNDTTLGWWKSESETVKAKVLAYFKLENDQDIVWDMIRAAQQSDARMCVVPLQDLLELDTEARMNLPGRAAGNWGWRYNTNDLSEMLAMKMRELGKDTKRL